MRFFGRTVLQTLFILLSGVLMIAPVQTEVIAQITSADSVQWTPPVFSEREQERHNMVKKGLEQRGISDQSVLEAMRNVPRHLFVPEQYQRFAYLNRPLPIGYEQTISQPYIVAYMTQMLDLEDGEKVLEIGTGSGYQAAVLSELTPHVFTIEIVEELGRQAKAQFDSLGYKPINTKIGDGYKGWPKYAPYDAIILTAAPEEIPQPLIEQLAPGGILVAPVGKAGKVQMLTRVSKSQDGELKRERQIPVRFVPMTGGAQKNGLNKNGSDID